MQSLKMIMQEAKSKDTRIKILCEDILISKGYVHNEVFGWEKIKILEKFGINPNCKGIGAEKYEDEKGKKKIGVSQNWLDYFDYKKSLIPQQLAQNYYSESLISAEEAFAPKLL